MFDGELSRQLRSLCSSGELGGNVIPSRGEIGSQVVGLIHGDAWKKTNLLSWILSF